MLLHVDWAGRGQDFTLEHVFPRYDLCDVILIPLTADKRQWSIVDCSRALAQDEALFWLYVLYHEVRHWLMNVHYEHWISALVHEPLFYDTLGVVNQTHYRLEWHEVDGVTRLRHVMARRGPGIMDSNRGQVHGVHFLA
jgi:hypothetical protein